MTSTFNVFIQRIYQNPQKHYGCDSGHKLQQIEAEHMFANLMIIVDKRVNILISGQWQHVW